MKVQNKATTHICPPLFLAQWFLRLRGAFVCLCNFSRTCQRAPPFFLAANNRASLISYLFRIECTRGHSLSPVPSLCKIVLIYISPYKEPCTWCLFAKSELNVGSLPWCVSVRRKFHTMKFSSYTYAEIFFSQTKFSSRGFDEIPDGDLYSPSERKLSRRCRSTDRHWH